MEEKQREKTLQPGVAHRREYSGSRIAILDSSWGGQGSRTATTRTDYAKKLPGVRGSVGHTRPETDLVIVIEEEGEEDLREESQSAGAEMGLREVLKGSGLTARQEAKQMESAEVNGPAGAVAGGQAATQVKEGDLHDATAPWNMPARTTRGLPVSPPPGLASRTAPGGGQGECNGTEGEGQPPAEFEGGEGGGSGGQDKVLHFHSILRALRAQRKQVKAGIYNTKRLARLLQKIAKILQTFGSALIKTQLHPRRSVKPSTSFLGQGKDWAKRLGQTVTRSTSCNAIPLKPFSRSRRGSYATAGEPGGQAGPSRRVSACSSTSPTPSSPGSRSRQSSTDPSPSPAVPSATLSTSYHQHSSGRKSGKDEMVCHTKTLHKMEKVLQDAAIRYLALAQGLQERCCATMHSFVTLHIQTYRIRRKESAKLERQVTRMETVLSMAARECVMAWEEATKEEEQEGRGGRGAVGEGSGRSGSGGPASGGGEGLPTSPSSFGNFGGPLREKLVQVFTDYETKLAAREALLEEVKVQCDGWERMCVERLEVSFLPVLLFTRSFFLRPLLFSLPRFPFTRTRHTSSPPSCPNPPALRWSRPASNGLRVFLAASMTPHCTH